MNAATPSLMSGRTSITPYVFALRAVDMVFVTAVDSRAITAGCGTDGEKLYPDRAVGHFGYLVQAAAVRAFARGKFSCFEILQGCSLCRVDRNRGVAARCVLVHGDGETESADDDQQ